jgi:transposase-like protein
MESTYKGHRFPPEIISHAVWLYHRFTLSFRDVEDLLAERGITVSYGAIRLCLPKTPFEWTSACLVNALATQGMPRFD